MQVSPFTHPKVSQYLADITGRYGFNACGLVAAAGALGGDDWISLVDEIATYSGDAYNVRTGIQPSPYANALRHTFGADSVLERNEWTLCDLYRALLDKTVVIIDIQVGSLQNQRPEMPTTEPPDYAHFARVLGIELDRQVIYVENTLAGESTYWELSLEAFWQVWQYPETQVSIRAPNPENVTRWAVVIEESSAVISARVNPKG
jgi:hypothetical protein